MAIPFATLLIIEGNSKRLADGAAINSPEQIADAIKDSIELGSNIEIYLSRSEELHKAVKRPHEIGLVFDKGVYKGHGLGPAKNDKGWMRELVNCMEPLRNVKLTEEQADTIAKEIWDLTCRAEEIEANVHIDAKQEIQQALIRVARRGEPVGFGPSSEIPFTHVRSEAEWDAVYAKHRAAGIDTKMFAKEPAQFAGVMKVGFNTIMMRYFDGENHAMFHYGIFHPGGKPAICEIVTTWSGCWDVSLHHEVIMSTPDNLEGEIRDWMHARLSNSHLENEELILKQILAAL